MRIADSRSVCPSGSRPLFNAACLFSSSPRLSGDESSLGHESNSCRESEFLTVPEARGPALARGANDDALSEALSAVHDRRHLLQCGMLGTVGLQGPALGARAHMLSPEPSVWSDIIGDRRKALVQVANSADIPLASGDVVILPHATRTRFPMVRRRPCSQRRVSASSWRENSTRCAWAAGRTARFVCGYFAASGMPIVCSCGPAAGDRINVRGDAAGGWLESSIRHLVTEAGSGRPDARVLLSKWRKRFLSRHCAGNM